MRQQCVQNTAEWLHTLQRYRITQLHMWSSKWPPPHSISKWFKKETWFPLLNTLVIMKVRNKYRLQGLTSVLFGNEKKGDKITQDNDKMAIIPCGYKVILWILALSRFVLLILKFWLWSCILLSSPGGCSLVVWPVPWLAACNVHKPESIEYTAQPCWAKPNPEWRPCPM